MRLQSVREKEGSGGNKSLSNYRWLGEVLRREGGREVG